MIKNNAYTTLVSLYQQLSIVSIRQFQDIIEVNSLGHTTEESETLTTNLPQNFVIIDKGLFKICSLPEWGLVGRITDELNLNNAIWFMPKEEKSKSSSLRSAIKGLVSKHIIIKTENPEFYIVNPIYIRRGNPFKVLATTAETIRVAKGLDQSVRGDKKALSKYNVDVFHLTGLMPDQNILGPLKGKNF